MTALLSDLIIRDIGGVRTAIVVPAIPDDAPPEVREGIARRRILYVTGECPCGARLRLDRATRRAAARSRKAGRPGMVTHQRVEHEDGCPAVDETLTAAMRRVGDRS